MASDHNELRRPLAANNICINTTTIYHVQCPIIEFFAFLLYDILGELSLSKGSSSGYAKYKTWIFPGLAAPFKKWKLMKERFSFV